MRNWKGSSGRPPRRLENLTDEERLKELGLFNLEIRTLKEESNHCPLLFKCSYRKQRDSLFTGMHGNRIKGNRHKFLQEEFHQDIRKKFSLVRTIIHWNRLLKEVVESPSLEVVKTCVETGPACNRRSDDFLMSFLA